MLEPCTLFDSNTYQQILSGVYNQKITRSKENQDDDDDKDKNLRENILQEKLFDERVLNNEREQENATTDSTYLR